VRGPQAGAGAGRGDHDLRVRVLELLPAQDRTESFAIAALDVMEQKKITSLPVVDKDGFLQGVLHLHDLWGTQMV
jgi:CBS domain-containing protein